MFLKAVMPNRIHEKKKKGTPCCSHAVGVPGGILNERTEREYYNRV